MSVRYVVFTYCWILFFFFQAEDGIRDRNVTGVQTCALPIFGGLNGVGDLEQREVNGGVGAEQVTARHAEQDRVTDLTGGRSEERRVGKECTSWWSAYQ